VTVERAALVEWWPLVDVAQLKLRPGDTVILRSKMPLDAESRGHLRMAWENALPGITALVANGDLDIIVKPAMREMRAEDLVQPVRQTTME
jgi:hypothetical protein